MSSNSNIILWEETSFRALGDTITYWRKRTISYILELGVIRFRFPSIEYFLNLHAFPSNRFKASKLFSKNSSWTLSPIFDSTCLIWIRWIRRTIWFKRFTSFVSFRNSEMILLHDVFMKFRLIHSYARLLLKVTDVHTLTID